MQEYRGDIGTALTDVVGMDAFVADSDLYFAKPFDGLRHESGDPIVWGEKALAHCARLRMDPATKWLVFSDVLDVERYIALHRPFAGRTQCVFGIGTAPDERHRAPTAEHRNEAHASQRRPVRQAVGHVGQDHV